MFFVNIKIRACCFRVWSSSVDSSSSNYTIHFFLRFACVTGNAVRTRPQFQFSSALVSFYLACLRLTGKVLHFNPPNTFGSAFFYRHPQSGPNVLASLSIGSSRSSQLNSDSSIDICESLASATDKTTYNFHFHCISQLLRVRENPRNQCLSCHYCFRLC